MPLEDLLGQYIDAKHLLASKSVDGKGGYCILYLLLMK